MSIKVAGSTMTVTFKNFDLKEYDTFLKCKKLPESEVSYDVEADEYSIKAPARFAAMLGAHARKVNGEKVPFNKDLFDYQMFIVKSALEAKRYAVYADCGLGKGQPHGSKVLTPSGWKNIESLQVGDSVIASDGKPYPVYGVYPKEEQDTYRFYFSDGASFVVDADHQHIVRTNNDRRRGKPWRVKSTTEMLTCGNLRYGIDGKSRNYDIPVVAPVQFPKQELPLHPYLLGVLIGDGCLKVSITFSSTDKELVKRVEDVLPEGHYLSVIDSQNYRICSRHSKNLVTRAIKTLGLFGKYSYEKFIPFQYLSSNIEDRLELLRGLMDTDGYIKDTSQFYTTSSVLAEDAKFLIQSLGGVPTHTTKETSYCKDGKRTKGRRCHVLTYSLATFNPFYLPRKAKQWNSAPRDNGRWIDRIEYEKRQRTICISVASPDASYVTENFIVTHNTFMFLEWARQVVARTKGKVLIMPPLNLIEQTKEEALKFYGEGYEIRRFSTVTAMIEWLNKRGRGIGIMNWEKLAQGQIPELKKLAGIILDESSILKTGGGVIKWNLIKSCKGIEYKLSCTATPAPNDIMEYASQAAFLEKLRTEGEILWTFFSRDKRGAWRVKPHAMEGYYRFLASWSIYMRNPAVYGFKDNIEPIPEPILHEYKLEPTEQQLNWLADLHYKQGDGLFGNERIGVTIRNQLSQVAKGFLYKDKKASIQHIESNKPVKVAEIIRSEVAAGKPVIVWTVFDEEGDILSKLLEGINYAVLNGKMNEKQRNQIIEKFRHGELDVIISKPRLLGFGLNFQVCKSMIFSGWNDSYEQWYQAVRRAYRYGQEDAISIHVPYIPQLEELILNNILRKKASFEEDAARQEKYYKMALGDKV